MRHVLQTQQFDRKTITKIFELATSLEGKRDTSLSGKILASVFYTPSTRTRLSFESAMHRLGGDVISVENALESSSQTKGETLEDTIRTLNNYADAIVLRHNEVGAAKRAAKHATVPIINAGDGNTGQHPTQALLDLYTIEREVGKIDGVHVAFVGNLRYYRTARSLSYLLGKYNDVRITFVSAPELTMKQDVKSYLDRHGVRYEETEDMQSTIEKADVVYQTRIAKEWIPDEEEYLRLRDRYILTRPMANSMKEGGIIIHPLPRVDEIAPEVDDSPHAVYFKQVGYGLIVRMALLSILLDPSRKVPLSL